MIKFATKKESESVVALWQEAFGDSRQWVLMYLDENIQNVLVYQENGVVMGMLSLLPVSYKDKKGYYVYGVATREEYRSRGISTKLLDAAKQYVDDDTVDFLVLVPRNLGLFEFYKERGFFEQYCVETECFDSADLEKTDERISKASAKEYYDIRKSHFGEFIEWDADMLASIRKLENGEFYRTESGDGAFCYAYNDTLYVKELCGGNELLGEVNKYYNCKKIAVTKKTDAENPSCMTYPLFPEKVFFNISID